MHTSALSTLRDAAQQIQAQITALEAERAELEERRRAIDTRHAEIEAEHKRQTSALSHVNSGLMMLGDDVPEATPGTTAPAVPQRLEQGERASLFDDTAEPPGRTRGGPRRGHADAMVEIVRQHPEGLTHTEVVELAMKHANSSAKNIRKSISNTLWWMKTRADVKKIVERGNRLYIAESNGAEGNGAHA